MSEKLDYSRVKQLIKATLMCMEDIENLLHRIEIYRKATLENAEELLRLLEKE